MKMIFTVWVSSLVMCAIGQEYPRNDIDPSRITDDLVAFQDQDVNYEDLYENYLQLLSNPLNLNKASEDQLRMLNILTDSQIKNLITHRIENGNLLHVYELQSVKGFDLQTIYNLMPFIKVSDPTEQLDKSFVKRVFSQKNNYLVMRYERTLEKSKGYLAGEEQQEKFHGSPDKFYFRFRASNPGDYSFGITSEKDAGEKIGWNTATNTYGADYLSCHFQIQNKKKITNLILGDYQFQFGQGLLLGNGFGLGKGGETITTIRKANIGFSPYTSVNESGYFRGAAGTFKIVNDLFISGFYSHTKRDATIYKNGEQFFSSFISTGLHRNELEMGKRKTVGETNYGAILNFKNSNLDVGTVIHFTDYNIPVVREPTPYNYFAFTGKRNTNGSAFFNYTIQNLSFFAEGGKSIQGGYGVVGGFLLSLTSAFDMSVLYRNYYRDFYTFYSNALSENTTPQNETGVYWGFKYRFNRKYSLSAYLDFFRFPWLKFRSYSPSIGQEFLLRFNYQPARKILLFLQYRQETKDRNTNDQTIAYQTATGIKQNLSANIEYELALRLKLRTRAQFSRYNFNNQASAGMALVQDVVFTIWKFEFATRHALFDTDDFDNRQYVYERDVWLAFSFPAYDGVGSRNYLIMDYKFNQNLSATLRYARTYYKDRNEIGSGSQVIEGNTKNDIKLQFVFRF